MKITMKNTRTRTALVTLAAVVGVGIGSMGIAAAVNDAGVSDHDEQPDVAISDLDLPEASAAAIAFTGGGKVTDSEVGDEESDFEVEVTLDDGTQVDVQLDADFNVVGSKSESAGESDDDEPNAWASVGSIDRRP